MKQILQYTAISLLCLASCKKPNDGEKSTVNQLTDYTNLTNWAVNAGPNGTKPVDVFFLYPTVYQGPDLVAEVTNEQMRSAVSNIQIRMVSVFTDTCNVFLPYYRQMGIQILSMDLNKQDSLMCLYAAADAVEAFNHYMQFWNNGRPFILAGHSQGSNLLLYILKSIQTQTEVLDKFVAAYAIGYAVTDHWMAECPQTPFATDSMDLGVIISWNTEAPNVQEVNPVITDNTARAINPIIWTTNTTYAPKNLSKGSCLYENNSMVYYPQYADAQVDLIRRTIITTDSAYTDYQLAPVFPKGVLHGLDYELYYYDLKYNVNKRIEAFLRK